MRHDSLARAFDARRSRWPVASVPADELWRRGNPAVRGQDVSDAFGQLAMYTTTDRLSDLVAMGAIGPGCWLTPTSYAACMAPYDLGLNAPRDVCLLIDVSRIGALWGPGSSRPSGRFPTIWQGAAIEFYCPTTVDFTYVHQVLRPLPCGDTHTP